MDDTDNNNTSSSKSSNDSGSVNDYVIHRRMAVQ